MLTIRIDDKTYIAESTMTIIDAARANGIDIPALEYDPRVSPPSDIEIAFVEILDGGTSRFVSATSTPVHDGMVIRTNSDAMDSFRKIYLQALLRNHYGDCVAPCVQRCPAHIDIQKYLYHVAAGNFAEALEVIKESNPLPSVCGRVCPHPCEADCRRNALDGAVNINAVKRFVADWDRYQLSPTSLIAFRIRASGWPSSAPGPAGLTAAYFLRRMGHSVTIFEMQEAAGGMLRWGIPYYRLPEKVLDAEIQSILDLGVEIQYNKKLGRDFTLESLKGDGYTRRLYRAGRAEGHGHRRGGRRPAGRHVRPRFSRQARPGRKARTSAIGFSSSAAAIRPWMPPAAPSAWAPRM